MIFTIGAVLLMLGYFWYHQTEFSGDWKDAIQFTLMLVGSVLVSTSLLILAWKWLP